jgi:hypothetical protein
MQVVRLTVEFLRPVPLTPLTVETRVTRPGGRVQLAAALLSDGEQVVCRAVALGVRRAEVAVPESGAVSADADGAAAPAPASPHADDVRVAAHAPPDESGQLVMEVFAGAPAMFAGTAMEIRFARGAFDDIGPAVAWFRLAVPLVEGERTTPLQRMAAASDFGNGISAAVPWTSHLFINPDLTVYVDRLPAGEWVGLDASTRVGVAGAGLTDSLLFDERGRIGRALQGLYVAER